MLMRTLPFRLSLQYFQELLQSKWVPRDAKPGGPRQFNDAATGEIMMLPSDMALLSDPVMLAHVRRYAADGDAFKADFAKAFGKLLELGVAFDPAAPTLTFTRTSERRA